MSNKTMSEQIADELKDGAMHGYNEDYIYIESTGTTRKLESGNFGFDIEGIRDEVDNEATFSAVVEVRMTSVGPSYE